MIEEIVGQHPLAGFLGHFEGLIGDRRTAKTFVAIVRGIVNGGSLVCQRIAAHAPLLAAVKHGAQALWQAPEQRWWFGVDRRKRKSDKK